MAVTLNDIGKSFLAQLYDIVAGGDANFPSSKNKFVSFCSPGLPFQPQDFEYCAKGLGTGADAEKDKVLQNQAFALSTLVDFIPDTEGVHGLDKQQKVWGTAEARLSHMYGEILRASKVVKSELTKEEKAKLEKFRNLLWTKQKNIVTDEEELKPGPVQKAYDEKLSLYLDAALVYNTKRVAAQAATGPEGKMAVADWTNNANLYRLKVKSAMDAWVSGGYRNEVDQMNAYINQVGLRDMSLWKQRLLENLEDGTSTALGPGQEFKFTTLVPGNFASARGWTTYSMSHEATSFWSRKSSKKWGGSAGVNFGLYRAGGSAGGQSDKYSSDFQTSSFKMTFSLAQVVISRSWFYPEFFMNRGWTLRKGQGWNFDLMPSNGNAENPKGIMIGYPTSIIFARDIVIESKEFAQAYSEYSKSVGASGSVGWGPIRLSGNYSSSKSGNRFDSKADGAKITVPGMQALGFVNYLIGKAPNPMPEFKDKDFQ